MNNCEEKKKRAAKTTRKQYEIYLKELRVNEAFRENKLDATQPNIIEDSWQNLCQKLNASGGPVKSVQEWKRVFTYWKSQVKSKAREFKVAQRETGNKENKAKPLNDLENMLLDIIGHVVVDGMSGVAQFGINNDHMQTAYIQDKTLAGSNCESTANLRLGEQRNISMLSTNINQSNNLESIEEFRDEDIENKTVQKRVNIDSEMIHKQVPKKKSKSLTGCLREIMDNKVQETKEIEVLCEIRNHLKNMKKLEAKRLQLERLRMQVKYPDHLFVINSDSE